MSRIKYTNYVADFETTVYEGQTETEVWASAIIPLDAETSPENVTVENNIDSFMNMLFDEAGNKKVYFHNLKFDGSFILPWLFNHGFKVWSHGEGANERLGDSKRLYVMPAKHFITMIGDMGQWYSITIRYKHKYVTFVDSLKLLPFSVDAIGKGFETKYRKLSIEYEGERHAHGIITKEETDYIKNDVLVMHEALNKLFEMTGEERLTIGSLCLSEFYKLAFHDKQEREAFLPDLSKVFCPIDGFNNADEYIRRSYQGGWCYADEKRTGIVNGNKQDGYALTYIYDVNSLYAAMMYYNFFPVGLPKFTKNIKDLSIAKNIFGFIRFRCNFELKPGYLPFIQIKNDFNFRSNENLKSTRYDRWGNILRDYKVEMTLSIATWNLFVQSYKIKDFEFLDGCIFQCEKGLFNSYIDHFMKLKEQATRDKNKVLRTIAKLFLNSLYGKFGKNPLNAFKVVQFDEKEEQVKYIFDEGEPGKPVYIPIACAITSYARKYTVKSALMNRDNFLYSDTDSIHLLLKEGEQAKGIEIHETKLGAWKLENVVKHSIFLRQKTYIEYNDTDYDIKACGLPERAKELFAENLKGQIPKDNKIIVNGEERELSLAELEFMETPRTVKDFKLGFSIPGKLLPKIIKGGTVLEEVDFTFK